MADAWAGLGAVATALSLTLPEDFERQARIFLAELDQWNRVGRLTGYQTEAARVEHLVLESLLFLPILPVPASPLLDIGTGPGVPGIVLKLARPGWTVTLVEANRRRANFLRHVVRQLGLADVPVHTARAEILAADPGLRSAFRTVTMRSVATLETALVLARPFLAPDGHVAIALRPAAAPPWGTIYRLEVPGTERLSRQRAFLIIRGTELAGDVPRGTRRGRGARLGRRQPERGGREDDDRRESGGGPRRC